MLTATTCAAASAAWRAAPRGAQRRGPAALRPGDGSGPRRWRSSPRGARRVATGCAPARRAGRGVARGGALGSEGSWLAPLRAAAPGAAYEAYLAQREARAGRRHLDCAEFVAPGQRELGLQVLSNLAELRLDEPALLQVMAWRFSPAGELELAAAVREKGLRLRPEEPQSRRECRAGPAELAEARGRPGGARAINLLLEVALPGPTASRIRTSLR